MSSRLPPQDPTQPQEPVNLHDPGSPVEPGRPRRRADRPTAPAAARASLSATARALKLVFTQPSRGRAQRRARIDLGRAVAASLAGQPAPPLLATPLAAHRAAQLRLASTDQKWHWHVHLVPLDGTQPTPLFELNDDVKYPRFSPDGKRVLARVTGSGRPGRRVPGRRPSPRRRGSGAESPRGPAGRPVGTAPRSTRAPRTRAGPGRGRGRPSAEGRRGRGRGPGPGARGCASATWPPSWSGCC